MAEFNEDKVRELCARLKSMQSILQNPGPGTSGFNVVPGAMIEDFNRIISHLTGEGVPVEDFAISEEDYKEINDKQDALNKQESYYILKVFKLDQKLAGVITKLSDLIGC